MTPLLDGLTQSALWWFGLLRAHADQIVGGGLCIAFGLFAAGAMAGNMRRENP